MFITSSFQQEDYIILTMFALSVYFLISQLASFTGNKLEMKPIEEPEEIVEPVEDEEPVEEVEEHEEIVEEVKEPVPQVKRYKSYKPKLTLTAYSQYSFVVRGDTKPHKEELKNLGGKWNPNLKDGAGWIFSNKRLDTVKKFVETS